MRLTLTDPGGPVSVTPLSSPRTHVRLDIWASREKISLPPTPLYSVYVGVGHPHPRWWGRAEWGAGRGIVMGQWQHRHGPMPRGIGTRPHVGQNGHQDMTSKTGTAAAAKLAAIDARAQVAADNVRAVEAKAVRDTLAAYAAFGREITAKYEAVTAKGDRPAAAVIRWADVRPHVVGAGIGGRYCGMAEAACERAWIASRDLDTPAKVDAWEAAGTAAKLAAAKAKADAAEVAADEDASGRGQGQGQGRCQGRGRCGRSPRIRGHVPQVRGVVRRGQARRPHRSRDPRDHAWQRPRWHGRHGQGHRSQGPASRPTTSPSTARARSRSGSCRSWAM